MKKTFFLLLIFGLTFSWTACEEDLEQKEIEERQTYLDTTSLDFQQDDLGFYYAIIQEGTGTSYPQTGNIVRTVYSGSLIDGTVFDSNTLNDPFQFTVGARQVITGFDYGIRKITKGGKIKLLIPSSLGYGAYASGSIPGYSTLIFDIELLDIAK